MFRPARVVAQHITEGSDANRTSGQFYSETLRVGSGLVVVMRIGPGARPVDWRPVLRRFHPLYLLPEVGPLRPRSPCQRIANRLPIVLMAV